MKLHSPQFEKALRRGIKAELRKDAALKREYRRSRRVQRRLTAAPLGFVLLGLALPILVRVATASTHHITAGLAIINLWVLFWSVIQLQTLTNIIFQSSDVNALFVLPVTNDKVFRWVFQRFVRVSFWLLFPSVLVAYVVVFKSPTLGAVAGVPVAALASWLTAVALTFFFLVRLPVIIRSFISVSTVVGLFVCLVGIKTSGPFLLRLLDSYGADLNLVLPSGWVPALVATIANHESAITWLLVIPLAILFITGKTSYHHVKLAFYAMMEAPLAADGSDDDAEAAFDDDYAQPQPNTGPTEIAEYVLSADFLQRPAAPEDRLENFVWNSLSSRQRLLVDFAFPSGLRLTRRWVNIFRNLLVAGCISLATQFVIPDLAIWPLVAGLFVNLGQVIQLLSSGDAFRPTVYSGLNIPLYAIYGIGYFELGRTLLKMALMQIPLLILWAITAAVLVSHFFNLPWQQVTPIALKMVILLIASRFLGFITGVSGTTNDTNIRWSSFFFLCTVALSVLCGFGLGFAMFFCSGGLGMVMGVLLIALAFGVYCLYGFWYNRNSFDLIARINR